MTATKSAKRMLRDIFPTKDCTRCGGCGRYSFNQVDGDMCYGCNGSGRMWANKKVAQAVTDYTEAVRHAKQPVAADLIVGDKVLSDLSYRADGTQTWQTITAIEATDDVCGWTGTDKTPCAWRMIITLSDGSVHNVNGNQIVRRQCNVDVAQYVEQAIAKMLKKSTST